MATTDPQYPANTAMMGIIHDALRRDLARAHGVLAGDATSATQRRAVAEHLLWMMEFLHAHHAGEDEAIYPVVRERNPAAAPVLDSMDADHRAVAPAIATVETAAAAWRDSDTAATQHALLLALGELEDVLLPHLDREEDEAMPVVAATLTDAELRVIDHERFIEPKSFAELGYEGHWLLDDLDSERREVVTGSVAAIPRFILLHGFARRYRRRAATCWDSSTPPKRRVQTVGRASVVVDAPIAAVWDIVRDPTRTGDWSHECHRVTWLDGATTAVPGARFRGRNHTGVFRWGRVCEIVHAQPWEITWRTVSTTLYPDSTDWTIRLEDAGADTTRIEQSFEAHGAKVLEIFYGLFIAAHRDRTDALTADLRRIGDLARTAHARTPDTHTEVPAG